MSNYSRQENFTAKDSLTTGDPEKVISGADMDSEFDAVQTAVNSKADSIDAALKAQSNTFVGSQYVTSGKLGVGVTSPYGGETGSVHIKTGSYGGSDPGITQQDDLTIENDASAGLQVLTPNNVSAYVSFGDPEDGDAGAVKYSHLNTQMDFRVEGSDVLRIESDGTLHTLVADYEGQVTNDDDIPNKKYVDGFESSEQTLSTGSNNKLSVAHGLGTSNRPSYMAAYLVCKTSDLNYSPGHWVHLGTHNWDGTYGYTVYADGTNIHFLYDENGLNIHRNNVSGRGVITVANWKVVLKARL